MYKDKTLNKNRIYSKKNSLHKYETAFHISNGNKQNWCKPT